MTDGNRDNPVRHSVCRSLQLDDRFVVTSCGRRISALGRLLAWSRRRYSTVARSGSYDRELMNVLDDCQHPMHVLASNTTPTAKQLSHFKPLNLGDVEIHYAASRFS
jgi:hypothetical protein